MDGDLFAIEFLKLKFYVIMFNYKRCLYVYLSIYRSLLALGSVVNINHEGCRKTYVSPPKKTQTPLCIHGRADS